MLAKEYEEYLLKEKLRIADFWCQTKIINNKKENNLDVATLLDNALKYISEAESLSSQMEKLYFAVTYRIANNMVANYIASVQPVCMGKADCFYFEDINEIQAEIKKEELPVKTIDLKTTYPANFFDSSFIKDDLVSLLAESVSLELDRIIIKRVYDNVGSRITWDFGSSSDTLKEKYERLGTTLNHLAGKIGEANDRGNANWIVTSYDLAVFIESCDKTFKASRKHKASIDYRGDILGGKFKLISDKLFPKNKIMFGYRGSHKYDAGYYFMPKLFFVEENNNFNRKLKTYFAEKLCKNANKFYGMIDVINFFN